MEGAEDPGIQRMLGRTVAEFAKLDACERRVILDRNLVQDEVVRIEEGDDEDFFNPDIAESVILRQEYFVGSHEAGKQLAKEARDVYYSGNTFYIRLYWLCEFMTDYLADMQTLIPVGPLVRRIIVEVDLHDEGHMYWDWDPEEEDGSEDEDPLDRLARWTVRRLGDLLSFDHAELIEIRLSGEGKADGSDKATHRTIKDIAVFVDGLIGRFGKAVHVTKVEVTREGQQSHGRSLLDYWERPTIQARERTRRGNAAFEEIIKVEIDALREEARRKGAIGRSAQSTASH